MRDEFVGAIRSKKKVRLTFFSKEDGKRLTRVCAPMDYGPSKRAHDKSDRFHFWDYESDTRSHTLSLKRDQIVGIEVLADAFEPSDFVTWKANWIVPRDWGAFS